MGNRKRKPHGAYLGTVKVNENLVDVWKGIPLDLANANQEENHNTNNVWVDLENNMITRDMTASSLHKRISDGLAARKYLGEVKINVVVARYTLDITPELLAKLEANNVVCHHLGFDSDKNKPPRDAADDAICAQIGVFLDEAENAQPQNVMVCSGDGMFSRVLIEARGLGHTTLGAFRPGTNGEAKINPNVTDSWLWRRLLGLPDDVGWRVKEEEVEPIGKKRKITKPMSGRGMRRGRRNI
uniref:NYN domain-containing protein n=1 Tax=Noccaea caerulescens TaxID=107243 RepID=A0A1J3E291_NOCCA